MDFNDQSNENNYNGNSSSPNGETPANNEKYNNTGNYFDGSHNINNNNINQNINNNMNRGMGNSPYGYQYSPPYIVPGQKLANAAMVLGIISILSTALMTIYIPMILGSIAIVLAILSRGTRPHITGQATTGLICGAGGLIMNIGILITSLTFIFSHPELLQEAAKTYDAQFEQIYGESTEDVLGQSFEDMVNEMFDLE